ncbi:MAG: hypothetical protein ACYCXF_03330 [Thermoleophilia bacterium]
MKTGARESGWGKARIFGAIAAPLVLAVVLALAFGGGISVGQSGYEPGLNISPASACVGSPVTFSGTLPPGSSVRLSMSMLAAEQPPIRDYSAGCAYGERCVHTAEAIVANSYWVDFGSTTVGSDGSWMLTARIPAAAESNFAGTVPTPAGTWDVYSTGSGIGGSGPLSKYSSDQGILTVIDCAGFLPVTGFSYPIAAIAISSLLLSAGIGLFFVIGPGRRLRRPS